MSRGFIPPHGGYQSLLSYRKALIIFNATTRFCQKFLDEYDGHQTPGHSEFRRGTLSASIRVDQR